MLLSPLGSLGGKMEGRCGASPMSRSGTTQEGHTEVPSPQSHTPRFSPSMVMALSSSHENKDAARRGSPTSLCQARWSCSNLPAICGYSPRQLLSPHSQCRSDQVQSWSVETERWRKGGWWRHVQGASPGHTRHPPTHGEGASSSRTSVGF